MIRNVLKLSLVVVMLIVVSGCSDKNERAGKLMNDLEFNVYFSGIEDGSGEFHIALKNTSENKIDLRSMSGNMFGVVVIDDLGKTVLDKEFDGIGSMTSGVVDVRLDSGEVIARDVSIDLSELKEGSYTFEFRVVSEVPELAMFAHVENVELGIERETFVFKGIVDGNSVEVIDLKGEYRVFAVEEPFMDSFEDLPLGVEISFEYRDVDGRDTISSEIRFE